MSRPQDSAPRSAAPGWYASPGEEGLARFWDGQRWTEGRQPLPPPSDAVPVLPMTTPIASPGFSGYPGVAGAGTGTGPVDPDGATRPFGLTPGGVQALRGVTSSPAVRFVSRAHTAGAALFTLVFAIIWLFICFAFMKPAIWDAARPGAGEATAPGIVVDQHSRIDDDGDRLCSPEATFVVDGQEYVAATSGASSDCPAQGSEVTVIYRVADPVDSHVAPSSAMQMLFAIFPVVGFLVLGLSLWMGFKVLGGGALIQRLRARRLPEEPGLAPPASPRVTWNP